MIIKKISIIILIISLLIISTQEVFAHSVIYDTTNLEGNKLRINLKWSNPLEERGIIIRYFYLKNAKVLNVGYELSESAGTTASLDFDLASSLPPIRVILRNQEESDKNFSDISGTEAEDYIRHLHDSGIVNGRTTHEYKPYDRVTRAEFMVLLLKALKVEPYPAESEFVDVRGHWAKDYINAAVRKDITRGYGDKTFRPNGEITIAEACTLISKAYTFKTHQEYIYSKLKTGQWYSGFVKNMFDSGILSTNDNIYKSFDEGLPINRGNTAIMLSRTLSTY